MGPNACPSTATRTQTSPLLGWLQAIVTPYSTFLDLCGCVRPDEDLPTHQKWSVCRPEMGSLDLNPLRRPPPTRAVSFISSPSALSLFPYSLNYLFIFLWSPFRPELFRAQQRLCLVPRESLHPQPLPLYPSFTTSPNPGQACPVWENPQQ